MHNDTPIAHRPGPLSASYPELFHLAARGRESANASVQKLIL